MFFYTWISINLDAKFANRTEEVDSLEAVDRLESLPRTGKRTPNLGERMLARVREFVASGAVAEAAALRSSPRNLALEELTRIHGVGAATAQAWFHELGLRQG